MIELVDPISSEPQDSTRHWWNAASISDAREREVGRHLVRVHCHGEHRPSLANVFLLHGMADSSETWSGVLPAFADRNIWLFDLPWSGRDGVDWPSVMSSEQWWELAVELAGVQPHVLVGHSFGATVLLDWALRRCPGTAPELILLSPFYQTGTQMVSWDDFDRFARGVSARFRDALRVRFGAHAPAPQVLDSMAEKLAQRVLPDGMLELFRVFQRSRYWALKDSGVSVAVLFGDREGDLMHGSAMAIADALPSATLHRLRDCGHHGMHEQTWQMTRALKSILAGETECAEA